MDVRTQARTAEGEGIFIYYHGFMKYEEAITKIATRSKEAKTTNFGDHEWFCSPRMETSIKALKWVETTLFVGQGRFVIEGDEAAVEYEIYKVGN